MANTAEDFRQIVSFERRLQLQVQKNSLKDTAVPRFQANMNRSIQKALQRR